MYPSRELKRLGAQKASLQADIALRRAQCAEAAALVGRPLEWLDRVSAFWRKYSPVIQLSALPLGFLVKRVFFPRFKLIGAVARWAPMVYGALRGAGAIMRPSARPSASRG